MARLFSVKNVFIEGLHDTWLTIPAIVQNDAMSWVNIFELWLIVLLAHSFLSKSFSDYNLLDLCLKTII